MRQYEVGERFIDNVVDDRRLRRARPRMARAREPSDARRARRRAARGSTGSSATASPLTGSDADALARSRRSLARLARARRCRRPGRRRVFGRRRFARVARARLRCRSRRRAPCTSITACGPTPRDARGRRPRPRAVRRRRSDRARVDVGRGGNLEARARDARYAALEQRARRDRCRTSIAVGHTRDDQAETVLLNLLRGSGDERAGGHAARSGAHCGGRCSGSAGPRRARSAPGSASRRCTTSMNDDVALPARLAAARSHPAARTRRAARPRRGARAAGRRCFATTTSYLDALAADAGRPGATLGAADARGCAASRSPAARYGSGSARRPPSLEHVEARARSRAWRRRVRSSSRAAGASSGPAAGCTSSSMPVAPRRPPPQSRAARARGVRPVRARGVDRARAAGRMARRPARPQCSTPIASATTVTSRHRQPGARFRPLGRTGAKRVVDALREAGVAALIGARAIPSSSTPRRTVCWVVGYRIDEQREGDGAHPPFPLDLDRVRHRAPQSTASARA